MISALAPVTLALFPLLSAENGGIEAVGGDCPVDTGIRRCEIERELFRTTFH